MQPPHSKELAPNSQNSVAPNSLSPSGTHLISTRSTLCLANSLEVKKFWMPSRPCLSNQAQSDLRRRFVSQKLSCMSFSLVRLLLNANHPCLLVTKIHSRNIRIGKKRNEPERLLRSPRHLVNYPAKSRTTLTGLESRLEQRNLGQRVQEVLVNT